MEIQSNEHYDKLFQKLLSKFETKNTDLKDVEFSLMDATFKACFEMILRENITPFDAMIIMTKQNIELMNQNIKLINMMPVSYTHTKSH